MSPTVRTLPQATSAASSLAPVRHSGYFAFPGEDLRDFEPLLRPEFSVGISGVVSQVLAI